MNEYVFIAKQVAQTCHENKLSTAQYPFLHSVPQIMLFKAVLKAVNGTSAFPK